MKTINASVRANGLRSCELHRAEPHNAWVKRYTHRQTRHIENAQLRREIGAHLDEVAALKKQAMQPASSRAVEKPMGVVYCLDTHRNAARHTCEIEVIRKLPKERFQRRVIVTHKIAA